MITIVIMETKYAASFFQLHYLFHLFHLLDLSSSRAFLLSPSVLPSSIILVNIVYYLCIITIKKPMNLNCLTCCYCYVYFIFVNNLSIRARPNFNSICTICKSSFRILWPIKDKQLIKKERLACSHNCNCACFIFVCFYWQLELVSITNLFSSIDSVSFFLRYLDLQLINTVCFCIPIDLWLLYIFMLCLFY